MKETESGCFFNEHSVCIFRLLICSCPDFFGYIVHVRNTWCNSLLSAVRCFQLLKAIAIHHREVLNYLIVYFGVSFQAYILHWDVHIPPNTVFAKSVWHPFHSFHCMTRSCEGSNSRYSHDIWSAAVCTDSHHCTCLLAVFYIILHHFS